MFAEYIAAALRRAEYKTIESEEPIFVSVPGLNGAWATGKTIEEARAELIEVIEEWLVLGIKLGHTIPVPIPDPPSKSPIIIRSKFS